MNELSNRYDGEVRAVDDGVARILGLLEETGRRDQTLVVFCSDHGEMLYEQENLPYLVQQRIDEAGGLPDGVMDLFGAGHRPWYYEDLWRTPLILSGPGMPRGERRGGLAANLDIYPTVLAALGLEVPPHLGGESLLGGREPQRERVFAYGHRTTAVLDRTGRKLVVHWPRSYLLPKDAEPPLQLFDLRRDPREQRDLAGEDPGGVRELLAAVEAWRAENEREVVDAETEETRRVLREMGYLGDDPEGGDR
jgi:arylsulfatase A-like enzyme